MAPAAGPNWPAKPTSAKHGDGRGLGPSLKAVTGVAPTHAGLCAPRPSRDPEGPDHPRRDPGQPPHSGVTGRGPLARALLPHAACDEIFRGEHRRAQPLLTEHELPLPTSLLSQLRVHPGRRGLQGGTDERCTQHPHAAQRPAGGDSRHNAHAAGSSDSSGTLLLRHEQAARGAFFLELGGWAARTGTQLLGGRGRLAVNRLLARGRGSGCVIGPGSASIHLLGQSRERHTRGGGRCEDVFRWFPAS